MGIVFTESSARTGRSGHRVTQREVMWSKRTLG